MGAASVDQNDARFPFLLRRLPSLTANSSPPAPHRQSLFDAMLLHVWLTMGFSVCKNLDPMEAGRKDVKDSR